jgi:methylenetetrahydrofolate reductase (NADPH)
MNRGIFIDNQVDVCHHSSFCIGVAAYPEKHSEAPSIETDINNLKRKIDAGADYIVTQMCFDTTSILNFIAACRRFGIEVPVAVGIKPLSSRSHLTLLPQAFGVSLPEELVSAIGECRDNEAVKQVGAEWAIEQGRTLKRAGVSVIHFYTMGRNDRYMQMIAKALF